ncbi:MULTISPECIES: DUF6297 family protein [Nocardiaceae]|uniref:ABC-2 type transport system permease protein n=1 Tax=Rhodococcoides kroppenstedtii TaxID=293050 RepID=A0ABS7NXL1_9NOCA|nr:MULTISPECIES: DUF6297 family protein [Rhodococcus]MBY6314630.1 hypothetical protein [Rhodococcus kroppenstedtii]MBY6322437.1 hypothetical protein [Rhodococcus kroppenstedtii]MBY6401241.1 hypothetical protein [Rhodococcus kroppenstedtii]
MIVASTVEPDTAPAPTPPSAALRRARRRSAGRPATRPLTTIGENAVVFVVLIGVAIQGYRGFVHLMTHRAVTVGVLPELLVLAALLTVMLTSFAVVGPLAASKPFSDLIVSTAAGRGLVLRRRFVGLVAAVFVSTSGPTWLAATTPLSVLASLTAVIVGCASMIVVAAAVIIQSLPVSGDSVVRWSSIGGSLTTVAAAIAAHHPSPLSVPAAADPGVWLVSVALAVLALAVSAVAGSRLHCITRRALDDSGSAAAAVGASLQWMDGSLLFGVIEDRWWRRVGCVRSVRLPESTALALVRLDLARPLRRPGWVFGWVIVAAGAHALWFGVSPLLGLLAAVGFGYTAVSPFARGLRQVHTSPALRRLFAHSNRYLYLVHSVVPTFAAIVWAALMCLVTPITVGMAMLIAAGLAGSALRAATRPPVDFGGPVVDSPFGLLPVSLIASVTRGLDLWLVTMAVVTALALTTGLA